MKNNSQLSLPIQRFTPIGLTAFRAYLANGPDTSEPPPEYLLNNPTYSEEISSNIGEVGVLTERVFDEKFDLAMHVLKAVGKVHASKLLGDDCVWPWLSLYFAPSTFPFKNSQFNIGASSRHVIETIGGRKQGLMHRHLVRGGVVAVIRFGQHARALLGKSWQQSKSEEEVMSRTIDLGLSASVEFMKLIETIYWDDKKQKLRSGAKGEGQGSIKRLVHNMRQLDVTYDVPSLNAVEMKSLLLPTEFPT